MFLAELAYDVVDQEIKELEDRQQRRNESLIESRKELENDQTDLHQYIAKDKMVKEEKEEEQKKLEAKKANKDETIKKLDQQILAERSEIEKNKEVLTSLTMYRDFLLSLSPKEFLEKRAEDHKQKKEMIKRRWIKEHMANPALDYYIIFKQDEDIHGDVKMQFSFQGKDGLNATHQSKKGGTKNDFSEHQKMKP